MTGLHDAREPAGIPLEGFCNEVAQAAAACLGIQWGKTLAMVDVDVRTDRAGRPDSVTFGTPIEGHWSTRQDHLAERIIEDGMKKNGLPPLDRKYVDCMTLFTGGFDGIWFTHRRPGAGTLLWNSNGIELPIRRGIWECDTHFISYYKPDNRRNSSIGPRFGWGIYNNGGELGILPARHEYDVPDRYSALAILGMVDRGDRGLIYDRLEEARSVLSMISMACGDLPGRLEYDAQRTATRLKN